MIDADDLAIGTILRVIAVRLAKIENPDNPSAQLQDICQNSMEAVATVPIAGMSPTSQIMVRAQAQAVIEHILGKAIGPN